MKKSVSEKGWFGLVIVIALEFFFFRNVLGSTMLFGDAGDGKLCTLLAEHWFKVFSGEEHFFELNMFWPEEGVLGYTDMLLGYGIIHSLFRVFGLNMYLSYKCTLILIHAMGSITLYFFLHKKLKTTEFWAVIAVMCFFTSNVFACKFGHTQLVAISFLPMIIWLVFNFFEHIENRKKKNIYAISAITLFALLLYTSWYIAFFTALFVVIAMLCYGGVLICKKEDILVEIKTLLSKISWDGVVYVVYALVIIIPFAIIYIPVSKELGNYSWEGCAYYLPEPIDFINVTNSNMLLGKVIEKMQLEIRGLPEGEVGEGFNLVFVVCLMIFFLFDRKKNERNKTRFFIRSVFYASALCILLITKLSSNGISLWYFVYKLVPGAGAIRAVARFLFFLHLPLSICLAYWGKEYTKGIDYKKKEKYICLGIMFFALFIAGIRKEGVYSYWNAHDTVNKVNSIAAPPEDCKVFYIVDSKKTEKPSYEYQLDAFEIATTYSLKTINGYSGNFPLNWDGIWDICSNKYEIYVSNWIITKQLEGVYAYDIAENTWISWKSKVLESGAKVLYPEANLFPLLIQGLEDLGQGPFSWSSKDFSMTVRNEEIGETGLKLRLGMQLDAYLSQNTNLNPYVQLYVNNVYMQDIPIIEGVAEYVIPVNKTIDGIYKIELKTNAYFIPEQIGINGDTRSLSLQIFYIGN